MGQYTAAKTTYEQLKGKKNREGKDYKAVLLQAFADFKSAGIRHKDLTRVRGKIEKW